MTETLSSFDTSTGEHPTHRKKLIEVALPLEAINVASAREKSIRHGHPSTLHLWWARRPLAACRAVLFAQLVDDPSSLLEEFATEQAQEQERQRLFGIRQALVPWENSNNTTVLDAARREIARSVARVPVCRCPRLPKRCVGCWRSTSHPCCRPAGDGLGMRAAPHPCSERGRRRRCSAAGAAHGRGDSSDRTRPGLPAVSYL